MVVDEDAIDALIEAAVYEIKNGVLLVESEAVSQ